MRAAALPDAVRAVGGVRLLIGRTPRGSAPLEIAESGGFRVRFPRAAGGACEGVLINTGGGLTGGDRVTIEAALAPGAAATLTTAGAEKLYRSEGADAAVVVAFRSAPAAASTGCRRKPSSSTGRASGAGSRWRWRRTRALCSSRSRCSAAPRWASACTTASSATAGASGGGAGSSSPRTCASRAPIAAALARPAVANGGRAVATCLLVAPDAEARLEEARAALERARLRVRRLAPMTACSLHASSRRTPKRLRADLIRFVETLRGPAAALLADLRSFHAAHAPREGQAPGRHGGAGRPPPAGARGCG